MGKRRRGRRLGAGAFVKYFYRSFRAAIVSRRGGVAHLTRKVRKNRSEQAEGSESGLLQIQRNIDNHVLLPAHHAPAA